MSGIELTKLEIIFLNAVAIANENSKSYILSITLNWNFFYSSWSLVFTTYIIIFISPSQQLLTLYPLDPIYFFKFLCSISMFPPKIDLLNKIFLLNLLHPRSVKYQPELGSETSRVNISIVLSGNKV